MKDALFSPRNLSLGGQVEVESLGSVDDEYCHLHSAYLQRAASASEKQAWDRTFLEEFAEFVRREDPKVLSTIKAIFTTGTQADAALDDVRAAESRKMAQDGHQPLHHCWSGSGKLRSLTGRDCETCWRP